MSDAVIAYDYNTIAIKCKCNSKIHRGVRFYNTSQQPHSEEMNGNCSKWPHFLPHSITYLHLTIFLLDEPKAPGPVELEQTVHGKVVISWAPSPDEELDDHLCYVVSQCNSNTRVWKTIADRLFTNTYTAYNIVPGIEYHFRIYAKNDVGLSNPSQSPTWGTNSNRGG